MVTSELDSVFLNFNHDLGLCKGRQIAPGQKSRSDVTSDRGGASGSVSDPNL